MGKNIWYISKYASPLKYGLGTRHFYLSKEFNKLGHKSIIISSDSNHLVNFPYFTERYTHEVIDGVDSWIIRTKRYDGPSSKGRILSWIDFELKLFIMPKKVLPRPDVIIVSSLSLFTIFNGYYFKKKYNAKLIFEIRDIWPLTLTEIGGFKTSNPLIILLGWIEIFGYKKADIIVGTIPNLAEHVEEVSKQGYKCQTVPQGVELSLYQNLEHITSEYISKYIPVNKFIIGYAGTIGQANALDTFIKVSILLKANFDIHFLLIGDGEKKKELENKVYGNPNITFAPRIKRTQVQSVLKYCDVLYDSAKDSKLYKYGLSHNKWIDYMFAGKPLIISYNGFKSMLNESNCGTFVPAENIDELKSTILYYSKMQKETLKEIGENGRKWLIENRTFNKLASDYAKFFV